MIFQVEVETEGREVYCIRADSEEDARQKFKEGTMLTPVVSEQTGSTVTNVTKSSAEDCG